MATYLDYDPATGLPKRTSPITISAGVGDANKFAQLDSSGRFDSSLMPAGIGAAQFTATAGEALAARDFVYVNAAGNILKADGTNPAKKAVGYVTAAVANAAVGTVLYGDVVAGFAGLTPGADYFLSHTVAGAVVLIGAVTTTSGRIVQQVGTAKSATELVVDINEAPIVL